MKPAPYPFAAIVGQEQMKLALLLAAIDWRLGVLLRGDKGAGKTTTARGLSVLLPEPAPFVDMPIGVTEDRLLGGLHLESTLKGNPVLKPGLLSQAHGGVLYIDEVNLLPAHLGDALLDAAASGVNVIEREGFSASHAAEFVLLGSMNPEEGLLRPQLLDRFALAVDITAPLELNERQQIVERRIAFERNPVQFSDQWTADQQALRDKICAARARVNAIKCSSEILTQISSAICEAGVRSLRADLSAVRAAIACAALTDHPVVEASHVDAVLPLVLNHRARAGGRSTPPTPQPPSPQQQQESPPRSEGAQELIQQIFAPRDVNMPALHLSADEAPRTGAHQATFAEHLGPATRARRTESPQELDLRATLHHAVLETGKLQPRLADLHERVRTVSSGVRFLFLIDSSGSHAAQEKMRVVKGAILALLHRSFRTGDEVALIAFRGTDAQVLLEPCRQIDEVAIALEYLPTGGRTPLAHALELAKTYVTPSTLLILLSDGRANVSLKDGDPWQETLAVAQELSTRALVIDTDSSAYVTGRIAELATVLGAHSIALAEIENLEWLHLKAR